MTPQEQQIFKQEIAEDIATITASILNAKGLKLENAKEKTLFALTVISEIDAKLPTADADSAISSTLDLLEAAAHLTPTQVDDKIVQVARVMYEFFSVNRPFKAWIQAIKARRLAKREKRRERIAAKRASN